MTCFKCSSRGYKTEDCPKILDDEFDDAETENAESAKLPEIPRLCSSHQSFPPLTPIQNNLITPQVSAIQQKPVIPPPFKRGLSTLESSSPSTLADQIDEINKSGGAAGVKLVQMSGEPVHSRKKRSKNGQDTPRPVFNRDCQNN